MSRRERAGKKGTTMKMNATWQRLLATTVISGAASFAIATPAFAQQTQPNPPIPRSTPENTLGADQPESEDTATSTGSSGQTITVTGSRIARPDLTSSSPVAIVDDEQLELSGTQTVESLLNDLPQIVPSVSRSSNNPSGGGPASFLDLRGLGPTRTLILVDGDRIPPSTVGGVVDVSQIPAGLIERVDVVTGGASAVYGSDAVSGVINFILKQDFQGLELRGQTGISQTGDGFNYAASGLVGSDFANGRGNIAVYGSFFQREGTPTTAFDYSRIGSGTFVDPNGNFFVTQNPADLVTGVGAIIPGGSAGSPFGSIASGAGNPFVGLATALPANFGLVDTDCNPATAPVAVNAGTLSFSGPGGALTNFNTGGACALPQGNSSRYDFQPTNLLELPYDRFNLSTIGRYEFTDRTRARFFAAYTNSHLTQQLAPTPAFGGTGFTVDPTTALFIPGDLRTALNTRANPDGVFNFGTRFTATGPRIGEIESNAIIGRVTLEHDINEVWRVDGSLGWGQTALTSYSIGNINRVAVDQGVVGCRNAAGVVNGPGVLPGCVPVNLFNQAAIQANPAMLSFIQTDTTDTSRFEQTRASVNVTGSLWSLPGGPIGVAFGAEVRHDRGRSIPDDAKQRGEIIGFNAAAATQGEITVREVYGELRLPILGGGGFPDLFSIGLTGRFSDYSTIGGIFNYGISAEFAPVPWVRFRGAYNKAARAPSVNELFQGGDQGFPPYVDPCNDVAARTPTILARCQAQLPGFNFTGFAQANTQVQAFSFGQPDLSEEQAETYTAGVVLTPQWFPVGRMSLTADYYHIIIEGQIQALSAGFYINQCLTVATPDPTACDRITRDPATGQIFAVNTGRRNSPDVGGPFETRGLDIGFNWTIPFDEMFGGVGRVRISNNFLWVFDYKIGGTEFVDTAGQGLGAITSEFANTFTLAVDTGPITIQGRYVYESAGDASSLFGVAQDTYRIPDYHYTELSVRYGVSDNFDVTMVVHNVLDKLPPVTIISEQNNSYPYFYGGHLLGRAFTVSAKVRF